MKLKLNIGNNIQLPYVPQKLTNTAMMAYVAALLICLVIYQRYALEWRWMILGIIEVCGFFYFLNHNTKAWLRTTPKTFTKKLFWWGFVVRLAWVGVSYLLYTEWTGTAFSIGAADELLYDSSAREIAQGMRDGNWDLFGLAQFSMGAKSGISDLGYPIYLGIIYFIFFDSILMARIIKAIFGAWMAVLMYRLASRNFGEYTGRMTGVVCMLMPNLIYYCSLQLKEVEMVFLAMLFAERADFLLRKGKLTLLPTAALMLIPLFMFMIRTALAATLVMAFFCALLLSSGRVVSLGRRALLIVMAVIFVAIMLMTSTSIGNEVRQMWETGASTQEVHAEWTAQRIDKGGFQQRFARYAGSAVFAPMIFTIPFPTMAETPGQENQKLIHGGNFVKNIMSFFTIAALLILLFSGDWRKHVLPLAILCGYLVVLVFSNFAHSERFHLPILPLHMMFAVYGISRMRDLRWVKSGYNYWCVLMIIAAIAWNWFKLAGRGMI